MLAVKCAPAQGVSLRHSAADRGSALACEQPGAERAMAAAASSTPDNLANQGAQWVQGVKEAVLSMAQREKKDEDEAYSPFAGLQKSTVLQECRCFNDREINPRKCIGILTKILWLLSQGEALTRNETTDIFFGVTKLLQNKDQQMRRLLYLMLKEVKPSPEEVIIVVATLTKDMNSKIDLNRGNAIRVLGAIIAATDPSLLAQIERHLKQARVVHAGHAFHAATQPPPPLSTTRLRRNLRLGCRLSPGCRPDVAHGAAAGASVHVVPPIAHLATSLLRRRSWIATASSPPRRLSRAST